ncbi:cytochrome c-type biogenesis protein [Croceifilum oryzae]|uniref:Cytochrome c-type biogenesis protein n=1 Tax=Croceifilum oryzae TaxID=1553429 RepID=A0AAJ1TCJ1_9BACL|nr:cytochrome c biogenesis protein CcdA [Croceifilum oryzae]MDQ0416360.1 cytochrome c-type biogenesis protein [Croceifilum oryzae]
MDVAVNVTAWLAFAAGFLSFISPCCLPLYPSYLSYITGISVTQIRGEERSKEMIRLTMTHTFFFLLGFSLIFYALGFTVSWIGEVFVSYKETIRMLSAILMVVMGLFMAGIFQPKFLMKEKKLTISTKRVSYLSSFLIGFGYSAGWTPCLGPILGGVLGLASSEPERALFYTTLYTIGFAIPFFIMAFFVGKTRWILKYSERIMKIGGYVMMVFGLLLYFDKLTWITQYLIKWTGFQGF